MVIFYYILTYLAIVSVISVIFTIKDKRAAINKKRRLSEKTLMTLAALGGGLAMYMTMIAISHKTKHNKFMIGIPVLVIIEAMVIITIYNLVNAYV